MNKYAGGKGEENINWKGGVAEYPDHAQLKRNRLERLKQSGNKCEVCGGEAFCVHHIDGSVDNHDLDNLAVLCRPCHKILHNGRTEKNFSVRPKTSKYTREYGMTLREMTERFGGSPSVYYKLHREGKLHQVIDKLRADGQFPESEHFLNQEIEGE